MLHSLPVTYLGRLRRADSVFRTSFSQSRSTGNFIKGAFVAHDLEEINDWKRLATLSEEPGLQRVEIHADQDEFFLKAVESGFSEKDLNMRFINEIF